MKKESSSSMNDRAWDIVVLGATGDAGMAISTYIADNYETYTKGGSNRLRWAIAGRSKEKLESLKSRLASDEVGVLICPDVGNAESMRDLASSTKILVSGVGPYTLLGETIFQACVLKGTHYVDVTGEVDWVGRMKQRYQEEAKSSGSTLCSFAGYDCVPCDIMLYLAHKELSKFDGGSAVITSLENVCYTPNGVFPRGTIRTTISKLPELSTFVGSLVRYAGSDGRIHWRTAIALIRWLLPKWSPEFGTFTIPNYMGWCNIPVVYGSHNAYLKCTFHDRFAAPNCKDYYLSVIALLYFFLLAFAPVFVLLQIAVFFVPSTAQLLLKRFDSLDYRGNSKEKQNQMDAATTDVWSYAKSSSGSKATVHLHVEGDAGIKATGLLAGETIFSMLELLDQGKLPRGVIGSPSGIVGDTLVDRLQDEKTIGHLCTLTVTVVDKASSKKKGD